MESVRHLNPKACDRIADLIAYTGAEAPELNLMIQTISNLAKTNPKFARQSLQTVIDAVEKRIVAGHFNFVLRGLPPVAPLRANGVVEPVGYAHVRDTLIDFGSFSNLKIFRGNAYVNFVNEESSRECSSVLNNMQIGKNIIKAECI